MGHLPFLLTPFMYMFSFGSTFPKRFHIAAVSAKALSVLVWTEGPTASKCMGFSNEKRTSVDKASGNICRAANPFRLVSLGLVTY